jgi:hypothetical protein
MLPEVCQGRQGPPDTRIVGHPAVLQRHVEVSPQHDLLTVHIDIADRFFHPLFLSLLSFG